MIAEEKIWEYLDGRLSKAESNEVEYAIANDSSISALYAEAAAIHRLLSEQSAEQPSMAFTDNVMRALQLQYQYNKAPAISKTPLLISALPFLMVLCLICAIMPGINSGPSYSYHLSTHFVNMTKLFFALIDGVLLMLFLEQWFYSKKLI